MISFDSEEENSRIITRKMKTANLKDDAISMVENEEKSKMVMFQVLRISLEDLHIEKRNLKKSSIERFMQFIMLHKLFYTSYFFLSYLERDEILKYIHPEKFKKEKFLWNDEFIEEKSVDVSQLIVSAIGQKRSPSFEKIGHVEFISKSKQEIGIKEFSNGRSPDWDKIDDYHFQFHDFDQDSEEEDFETNELMTQIENDRISFKRESMNTIEQKVRENNKLDIRGQGEIFESLSEGEGGSEENSSDQSIIENEFKHENVMNKRPSVEVNKIGEKNESGEVLFESFKKKKILSKFKKTRI